ncbi:hypothetical protein H6G33_10165 [Calothrix sp. FACHB-1219]|uniref:hypothetical protein n=1 Tax=unclassified Calothrix TaxID=2619626 RepID=UPI0016823008|nr:MULTISPECIES: hypothetical protein [unclassified Calothrix]MBD2201712.1 hypothetical protein [Calothrix sp. FACHB-168]MBD2217398.1 hypothetical protein [Calothrix sp. FACHB-1219]
MSSPSGEKLPLWLTLFFILVIWVVGIIIVDSVGDNVPLRRAIGASLVGLTLGLLNASGS